MNTAGSSRPFIIAIDGPAGSGKTTTARLAARILHFIYIDTGAMYRAVALAAFRNGLRMEDEERICSLLPSLHIELLRDSTSQSTILNGENVEALIRTPEMSKAASDVSRIPCVRDAMVRLQREAGEQSDGAVLEGRDIGTVVFPGAPLKIYLVASVEARARRRQLQLSESGITIEFDSLVRQISERDHNDSTRSHSPLRKADDAVELDTTDLTIDEQVDVIVGLALQRMKKEASDIT